MHQPVAPIDMSEPGSRKASLQQMGAKQRASEFLVNYYGFNGAQALVGGADVVQARPTFDNDWTLTRSTGGIPLVFGSGNSDEVIDVPNLTTARGTQLDGWQANGGDNQKWYLQRAGNLGNGSSFRLDAFRIISVYGNDWNDARRLQGPLERLQIRDGAWPPSGAQAYSWIRRRAAA